MNTTFYYGIMAAALGLSMAQAVEDVPMKVTKAAVFKNGYSQISLTGKISGQETQLRLLDMPVPILGSFWWKEPQGAKVSEVRSESATVRIPKTEFSNLEFLRANPGKMVEIVLSNGSRLEGIIYAPKAEETVSSFRQCHYTEPEKRPKPAEPTESGDTVQLRTANGIITLREPHIMYAELKSDTVQYPSVEKQVPALVFELDTPAAGANLQVSSLSSGLSWLPVYRMDLKGDNKAYFQCKAMVMNELADLDKVKLELVMGYPALGKHLLPSPVARYHALHDFLRLISSNNKASASILSQNIVGNSANYISERQGMTDELSQAEDLFFYTIPNFSCHMGQTVTREIFGGEVEYSHVYTWNIPAQSDIEAWKRSQQNDNYRRWVNPPNEVWHCIRVRNSLKNPWTTGVLDCYAEGRLVGRSKINFTDDGGTTLVKLNKTMQAPVQYSENILKREGSVMTFEGRLSLANHSDKEIQAIITKDVEGTPLSANENASISCTPDYGDNPDGQFRWEVTIAPGEKKILTYQYSFDN